VTEDPGAPMPPTHRDSAGRFLQALRSMPHVFIHPEDTVDDLIALRQAFADPGAYDRALGAIRERLARLSPRSPSGELRGPLKLWRKHVFASDEPEATVGDDLRIVYRTTGDRTVEVLILGHRHLPRDIYARANARLRP